jgi:hypothetical protein
MYEAKGNRFVIDNLHLIILGYFYEIYEIEVREELHGEIRNIYRTLSGKPEMEINLWHIGVGGSITIKLILK